MSYHQPPSSKTLQVKLERSKEAHNDSANGGMRISLKRRPSKPAEVERFVHSPLIAQDSSEEEEEDQEEEPDSWQAYANHWNQPSRAVEEHYDDEEEEGKEEEEDDQDAASPSHLQANTNGQRSRPIKKLRSKGLYESIPKLIENFKRRDSYKFFWDPVDLTEVPNYLDYIKEPMDLGTIEKKVKRREYSHMNEFKRDFLLVVRNAQTFNPPGTLYFGEGKKLENWGMRAIQREGLAINDNGRAGIKGEAMRRAAMGQSHDPAPQTPVERKPRKTHLRMAGKGAVGLEALIDAARLKPGDKARAAAALALAKAGRTSGGDDHMDFNVKQEDDDSDMDDDMDDDDDLDGEISFPGGSRERSVTADLISGVGTGSRRMGSSRLGASSISTPGPGLLRGASPESLQKRLVMVTGTPLAVFASSHKSTPSSKVRQRHRLGPPGTPKRLAAVPGVATPSSAAAIGASTIVAPATAFVPTYNFAPDGSIDPEDIEDIQSYLTVWGGDSHTLMPTVKSLHPIPFVPHQHAEAQAPGGKEKAKEREDDDDKDGDKEKKDKADKDPLHTLPPTRPGAPDPLFTATAPEPEPLSANYSVDIKALPLDMQATPFLLPSGDPSTSVTVDAKRKREITASSQFTKRPKLPLSWENTAYTEAIRNESRPKKQKDKEREKEKETLEDWTHHRPAMTRLLEVTDLGLFGTMVPASKLVPSEDITKTIRQELDATSWNVAFSTMDMMQSVTRSNRGFVPAHLRELGGIASQEIRDLVFGGPEGMAYARSVAEFVGGAMETPFISEKEEEPNVQETTVLPKTESISPSETPPEEEHSPMNVDDPEESEAAEEKQLTPTPPSEEKFHPPIAPLTQSLNRYVEENVINPLTGGMLNILHLVASELGNSKLTEEEVQSRLLKSGGNQEAWLQGQPELVSLLEQQDLKEMISQLFEAS